MTTYDLRIGDCLDPVTGLASLADKSCDHIICDPPYSEHIHANSRRGALAEMALKIDGRRRHCDISRSRDLGFEHITTEIMKASAHHFARVTRRWSLVFCDVESVHLWMDALRSAGLEYVRTCAWIKQGAAPQFTGDRPASGFETIVCAHQPGRKKWNGGGKQGVYDCPIVIENGSGARRLHPTQKPLRLMRELVADFTDDGETIVDPFAGSGTTLIACINLGRNCIGWERDAQHHATATRRLNGDDAKPAPGQLSLIGGIA